MSINVI